MEHSGRRPDTAHLLRLARHLTDRDHRVLSLLRTHRVLTTPQIAQVAFTSHSRAVQRLRVLTGLGLVARFRPRRDRGSAPWHYVIDTIGAHVLAANDGTDVERSRVRQDRQLAVARSTHLEHRVGANGFFTALIAAARTGGRAELGEWLNATDTAERVDAHCGEWGIGLPHPDGYGHWAEGDRSVEFFLEWDTGTETHRQLTRKMERYADFTGAAVRAVPWVLFVFPTPRRETNARGALRRVEGVGRVPVATAHLSGAQDPNTAVWSPLSPSRGLDRVALIELVSVEVIV
ncbi:replication-relaxation family protein [Nocardiopsis metallicus]|uniref:Putative transcriptional regulator n=1 Tax=Nocardiopsis metallicus TaxID=179819 RepID=A0A840WJX3_9ACTN|nr:replication-relaxation family protein [Nocardiopsis metallicus]MBB5491977.1 putative transcriptional regulator [Nocardiopsis metallicus]